MKQNNLERAKDLLPAIILTVLSMIQALALELLWSRIEGSDFLWQLDPAGIIGWLQLLVMLSGILLIWVMQVSFVLRFTWLPSLEDAVLPFFIGLLEFIMIDLSAPEFLGIWFVVLAAVFSVATAGSHLTMRQARRDPANDYFFSQIGAASLGDYKGSIAVAIMLCAFGLLIWLSGNHALLSIVALLIALLALLFRFHQVRHYWMHSLVPDPADH
jgi:hypothetical protein